jgi:acetyltransferase-like isoleucine patch superfamily enzyme
MTLHKNRPISRLKSFLHKPFHDKLNVVEGILCSLKGRLYYRHVFGSFGRGSKLYKPLLLSNPRFMHIGENVHIRPGARLEAILIDPNSPPELRIGNNVNIEQDVHIVFMGKVLIADNVSITGRCSLLGCTHPFLDIHNPVKIGDRLSGVDSVIEIGEGSFIGIGTVIFMNVTLGKHVVIGSNSVVNRNIPDYCVAAGSPAEVVKRYDHTTGSWHSV